MNHTKNWDIFNEIWIFLQEYNPPTENQELPKGGNNYLDAKSYLVLSEYMVSRTLDDARFAFIHFNAVSENTLRQWLAFKLLGITHYTFLK